MPSPIHILNGDALLQKFPPEIDGRKIVFRESLVQGNVEAADLQAFISARALFMQEAYAVPIEQYLIKSVPELSKLAMLKPEDEIYLWFEDDLFCQVNMWFVSSMLRKNKIASVNWVRANSLSNGYGDMDNKALLLAHQNPTLLQVEIKVLAELWKHFKSKDTPALKKKLFWLPPKLKPIAPAIEAELDRHSPESQFGRPGVFVEQLFSENPTMGFEEVFSAFKKELGVYGFGDLQVQYLFEQIRSKMN